MHHLRRHPPHHAALRDLQGVPLRDRDECIRGERRALAVFAAVALAAIAWIASPVAIGILLGTLLGFSIQPLYVRLVARYRRPRLTAAACVAVSAAGLLAILSGLSSLLIARGAVLLDALIGALAPGGRLRAFAESVATRLGPFAFRPDELTGKLRELASTVASRAAAIAAAVATTTFSVLLALFFALMTLSLILRRWSSIAKHIELVLPLRPKYTRALLDEFKLVGRTTLLGTVVTGLAQGVFAGFGYWISGVPEPAFFGAATAVASLIPGFGTVLVWVPAGIFLIAMGHPAMGALELCWGALVVVGISDYVLRPRLIGGNTAMPPLLTLAALFGGIEVFGLAGLVVGPLIMSVSCAVLRIFARETAERRTLEAHA